MNEFTSFVELVKAMREAQKKYFSNRTQTDLQRSKLLEKQVDVQIEKIAKEKATAEQITLL